MHVKDLYMTISGILLFFVSQLLSNDSN